MVVVVGGGQAPKAPTAPALLVGFGQASAKWLSKLMVSVRWRLNVPFPGVALAGAAPLGVGAPS